MTQSCSSAMQLSRVHLYVVSLDFDTAGQDERSVPVPPLRGCPCTTTAICEHWQQHLRRKVFRSCDKVSCHGNATTEASSGSCCVMCMLDPTKTRWVHNEQESLREPSPEWLGIHGDAGALLSVGLLNKLDYDTFEACLMNITFYGAAEVSFPGAELHLSTKCLLTNCF